MAQTMSISKSDLEAILDAKLKSLHDKIEEMNASMKFLNLSFEDVKNKVDKLEDNLDEVNKENQFLKQETLKLSNENKKLTNIMNNLCKELNDIQQYQRRDCCEIMGLPVTCGENINDLVIKVGTLMDLDLKEDISVSSAAKE